MKHEVYKGVDLDAVRAYMGMSKEDKKFVKSKIMKLIYQEQMKTGARSSIVIKKIAKEFGIINITTVYKYLRLGDNVKVRSIKAEKPEEVVVFLRDMEMPKSKTLKNRNVRFALWLWKIIKKHNGDNKTTLNNAKVEVWEKNCKTLFVKHKRDVKQISILVKWALEEDDFLRSVLLSPVFLINKEGKNYDMMLAKYEAYLKRQKKDRDIPEYSSPKNVL